MIYDMIWSARTTMRLQKFARSLPEYSEYWGAILHIFGIFGIFGPLFGIFTYSEYSDHYSEYSEYWGAILPRVRLLTLGRGFGIYLGTAVSEYRPPCRMFIRNISSIISSITITNIISIISLYVHSPESHQNSFTRGSTEFRQKSTGISPEYRTRGPERRG